MDTALRIINTILILFALFMGLKQGWAMVSGKSEMIEMFSKWNIGRTTVMALGIFTMIGAVMVLFPKTFVWGNFMTAAGILFIIVLHLSHRDLKGVMIELPFFLMSWVILYLQYPFSKLFSPQP